MLVDNALPAHFPISFVSSVFTLVHLLVAFPQACEHLMASGLLHVLAPLVKSTTHLRFSTRVARICEVLFLSHNPSFPVFAELGLMEMFAKRMHAELALCEHEARLNRVGDCHRSNVQAMRSLVLDVVSRVAGPARDQEPMETSASSSLPDSRFCSQERKSLLKVTLRLLLNASHEPIFGTSMRSLVEGGVFLDTLETLLRGPEYFGTTLWGQASKWITDFCNNEPAMLPLLQDAGIDRAIFDILSAGVPPSSEILSELPGLLSALCLNARGLQTFVAAKPLNVLLQIFLSKKYLPCLGGGNPSELGAALDELMRHQSSLLPLGVNTIIRMLQQILEIGSTPGVVIITGKR